MSKLELQVEKIDCCVNGCLLYFKEVGTLNHCKVIGACRYVPRKSVMGKDKDLAVKKMLYFPIILRLQRLYTLKEFASQFISNEMASWEHNNSNIFCHPSNGKPWKQFDEVYLDYACDTRNVRLCLCIDGFESYIQASSSPYSHWSIIVTPYNLPPEMFLNKPYMFLTCLVPRLYNPKVKIDAYLQPLIDDLRRLWRDGIVTYDISMKQNFVMRAHLMLIINDLKWLK